MFLMVLLSGFAGSFHCVGMCGGFACGLAQTNTGSKSLLLLKSCMYNAGRLLSYSFIGVLAGALGGHIIHGKAASTSPDAIVNSTASTAHMSMNHWSMNTVLSGELGIAQRMLSVLAGLLMLVMALELLGIRRHVPATWGRIGGIAIARVLNTLIQSNKPSASVALGIANGFLPCPLVMSFAAVAGASASAAGGFLTMLAFGLGTFPAMFLMSSAGLAISPSARQRGVRFAGVFVLAFGLFTVSRGLFASNLAM